MRVRVSVSGPVASLAADLRGSVYGRTTITTTGRRRRLLLGERHENLLERGLAERIVIDGQPPFGRVHQAEHAGPFAGWLAARNVVGEQTVELVPIEEGT